MNRKYEPKTYRKIIEKLKDVNPKIEISSDFIIGYPGETDNDFQETLDLVSEINSLNRILSSIAQDQGLNQH